MANDDRPMWPAPSAPKALGSLFTCSPEELEEEAARLAPNGSEGSIVLLPALQYPATVLEEQPDGTTAAVPYGPRTAVAAPDLMDEKGRGVHVIGNEHARRRFVRLRQHSEQTED